MHKIFLLVILIGALIFGAATSIAVFRWPYGMSIVPVGGDGTADYSWVPALVLWGLYLLVIWLLSVFTKLPVTPATYVVGFLGVPIGGVLFIRLLWWMG